MTDFDSDIMYSICDYLRDKGWERLGSGRHRITYGKDDKNIVIKVPYSLAGAKANISEFKVWHRFRYDEFDHRGLSLARCKLIYFKKYPLIVMEKVKVLAGPSKAPDIKLPGWCFAADSFQVGTTKNGKLVAYDYSCSNERYWPKNIQL